MSKKKINGVIYSTNPNFKFEDDKIIAEKLKVEEQNLRVYVEKRKGGKSTVIIKNFIGNNEDLKTLAKTL